MPVTVHSVLARAPARAMTRGSPNRSPGALRPSWVRVGCDIRAKAGLSKTHPWPTFSVSSSRVLIARARACNSGRLCKRRATPRSSGEFTTVSTLRARPSLRYCFTREWRQNALMVTPLLLRSMAVLNVPPAGSLGLRPRGSRLNRISTCSGRPRSRVVGDERLEERPGLPGGAEHHGPGYLDLAHRQLPPVPGRLIVCGQRHRDP